MISFNETAASMLGHNAGTALGRNYNDILPPECRKQLYTAENPSAGVMEMEIECALAGRTVPLEIVAAPLRDENNEPLGTIILFRDMTEIRRLRREIARSQRLAALGSLAAGIAHEIRNPLSSIKGFATYFRDRLKDNPNDAATAEIMIRESDRLNRYITQLLELPRPLQLNLEPRDISPLVRHVIKLLENQAREKSIEIASDISGEPTVAMMDQDKIEQVLLNLLMNALAAPGMDPGGRVKVSAEKTRSGWVRIVVSDTGAGIPEELLPRIFDPFFTTRSSGTGLGLAVAHKIIESHGGEIRVSSEPGKGAAFEVLIPGPAMSTPEQKETI